MRKSDVEPHQKSTECCLNAHSSPFRNHTLVRGVGRTLDGHLVDHECPMVHLELLTVIRHRVLRIKVTLHSMPPYIPSFVPLFVRGRFLRLEPSQDPHTLNELVNATGTRRASSKDLELHPQQALTDRQIDTKPFSNPNAVQR